MGEMYFMFQLLFFVPIGRSYYPKNVPTTYYGVQAGMEQNRTHEGEQRMMSLNSSQVGRLVKNVAFRVPPRVFRPAGISFTVTY